MNLHAAVLITSLFSAAAFAAAPVPGSAPSPTEAKPAMAAPGAASANPDATVTATCKDGTSFTGSTKKGACSGHQGVKSWAKADMVANPMNDPKDGSKAAGKQTSAPLPAAAAGGGAGKVWVNSKTNTYHCQSDRFYGKTKEGGYMTESEAKAKGAHADHGKGCA